MKILTNAVVNLDDTTNQFAIAGRVRKAIKNSDRPELVSKFTVEAFSGNYMDFIMTVHRYVTVETNRVENP